MRVVPILCFTYYECKLGLILGAATPAALPTGGQRIGLERLFSPSPGRFHLKKSCAIMLDGAIQTSIDMQILCLNTTPHYTVARVLFYLPDWMCLIPYSSSHSLSYPHCLASHLPMFCGLLTSYN